MFKFSNDGSYCKICVTSLLRMSYLRGQFYIHTKMTSAKTTIVLFLTYVESSNIFLKFAAIQNVQFFHYHYYFYLNFEPAAEEIERSKE